MRKRILKNIDWGILICSLALLAIGLIALISATQNTDFMEAKKQIQWFFISVPIVVIIVFIDYDIIAKYSPIFYGIFVLLLFGVLFTSPINGARSWYDFGFMQFQPAEFAKIFVILFLAYLITKIQERKKDEINNPLKLLMVIGALAIPLLLILKQPDYGTAVAFIIATAFMLFVSGIKKRYIISALAIIVITIPIAYMYILPDHAKKRIDVFLDPSLDPRGSGYNIIQSKLAIGAGQLLGMGVLKGNQTQLGFLHPKTTDFIFSVIGEEMGFIATGGVLVLYVVMITKAIYVAKTAKDDLRFIYCNRYYRDILFSHDRKHWYDNRLTSNYRCTTTICKLWRKFITYKFYTNCTAFKYKWKKTKSDIR